MKAILVLGMVAALAAGLGASPAPPQEAAADSDIYRDIDRLVEVLHHIRSYYVEETDDEELIRSAIKKMLADLDPHSQFLEGEQYRDLRLGTTGVYTGVGMEVSTRRGFPVVVSPMEGTPAQRAGLLTGDVITAIDGADTFGLLLQDAVTMLRGREGTSVGLTVKREGEPELLEFKVVREVIRIPSIPLCRVIDGEIGYVKVARYSEDTANELETCMDGLESTGVKGLVLDLRGNPGGLLMEAVKVCELFVPKGKLLVFTKGRLSGDSIEYISDSTRTRAGVPLVVLVDGGTASAAEIVAGAIQDWDLGLVLGEPTFGKGSVQRVLALDAGKALKLTTAYYFTPSGRCIDKEDAGTGAGEEPSADAGLNEGQEFTTAGGRRVFGGGGIKPDVIVHPSRLPALTRSIEGRGLFFSFAVDYVGSRGDAVEPVVTPDVIESFREFLLDEGISFDEKEYESAVESISLGIRRELARRLQGETEARLVAMEGDAQLHGAVEILKQAVDIEHLFKLSLQTQGDEE